MSELKLRPLKRQRWGAETRRYETSVRQSRSVRYSPFSARAVVFNSSISRATFVHSFL